MSNCGSDADGLIDFGPSDSSKIPYNVRRSSRLAPYPAVSTSFKRGGGDRRIDVK